MGSRGMFDLQVGGVSLAFVNLHNMQVNIISTTVSLVDPPGAFALSASPRSAVSALGLKVGPVT